MLEMDCQMFLNLEIFINFFKKNYPSFLDFLVYNERILNIFDFLIYKLFLITLMVKDFKSAENTDEIFAKII